MRVRTIDTRFGEFVSILTKMLDHAQDFSHRILSIIFQLKGYKVTDVNRTRKFGVACRSLQELKRKGCAKLNVSTQCAGDRCWVRLFHRSIVRFECREEAEEER